MLNNTKRLILENENLIEQVKEELSRLMDQQIKNINQGFNDLITKPRVVLKKKQTRK